MPEPQLCVAMTGWFWISALRRLRPRVRVPPSAHRFIAPRSIIPTPRALSGAVTDPFRTRAISSDG